MELYDILRRDPKLLQRDLGIIFAQLVTKELAPKPPEKVVVAALLSERLEQDEFDALLDSGIILNDDGKDQRIPRLSIFQLYCVAKFKSVGEPLGKSLEQLCLMEIRRGKGRNCLGYQFEEYHAQWKCVFALLRRSFFENDRGSLSLNAYYNHGINPINNIEPVMSIFI